MRNPVRGDAITKTVCTRWILALLRFYNENRFQYKADRFYPFCTVYTGTGMKLRNNQESLCS